MIQQLKTTRKFNLYIEAWTFFFCILKNPWQLLIHCPSAHHFHLCIALRSILAFGYQTKIAWASSDNF